MPSLTLGDVNALLARERGPIWAGELAISAAEALGLATPNVYLSLDSLRHIFEEHSDVSKYELLRLPFVIRNGLLIQERAKPQIVIACYQIPNSPQRVAAVLKATNQNAEMWVQTYHRTHRRQTRAQIRRGNIIKYHD
jgi:hypothetical protein